MNIKTRYLPVIVVIFILALVLVGCRAEDLVDELCPIDETTGEYDEDCLPIDTEAYSANEAYPVEEIIIDFGEQSAYPITESDLSLLLRTWRLAEYSEDGVDSEPPDRTLSFKADGSYTVIEADTVQTGTWTTILRAVESTLMLDPDTQDIQQYEIMTLGERELTLRTWRDNVEIEERYLPAD